MSQLITPQQVADKNRIKHTSDIFGIYFPLNLEPFVYQITSTMVEEYNGGYWEFYSLSNGGFYMAPHSEQLYSVSCDNGFEGQLSEDALGITSCLYAYSHLSFCDIAGFSEICAEHYHLLRAFMLEHKEAASILSAID